MSRIPEVTRLSLILLALVGLAALVGCPSSTPSSDPQVTPVEPAEEGPAGEEAVAETEDEEEAEASQAAEDTDAVAPKKSELLLALPTDVCNTPDAMALLPDGDILLSVPNFNNLDQPALFMKISPDNEAVPFLELPKHPETNQNLGPLGVCVAPSGDIYFADYQMEGQRQSRVMKIAMKDGLPEEIVPVITGFTVSNAVIVRDGYLYVSETQIDVESMPRTSGVFRFKLEDLQEGIVELATPITDDAHLIATIETFNEELPLGADGLTFDDDGNLYIGNFSDGTVHKLEFDAEGKVTSNEIFAKADFMKSADGLFFNPADQKIYVADSKANAVQVVSLDGSVATLAQNGPTDGLDGGMDQPCEVLVRGNQVIVSNMDWPVPGCVNTQYDEPCTICVIKLGE